MFFFNPDPSVGTVTKQILSGNRNKNASRGEATS